MTSFDFVFNNPKTKSVGKVFAKRRKVDNPLSKNDGKKSQVNVPTSKNDQESTPAQKTKTTERKDKSNTLSFKNTNKQTEQNTNNATDDTSNNLIKRKKKKDKQLLQNQQGDKANTFKNKSQHSLFSENYKTITINSNIKGASVVEKVFSVKNFNDLNIHRYIVSNLEKNGFTTLTNVQEKAIPVVLEGNNVLIRSQTGSGKTLAYAVPIIDALQSIEPKIKRDAGVQAIIVVPTRELALQTHEIFSKINTFQWIVVGHLCGGENRNTEKSRLRKGTHILIATPGRLLDHLLHTSSFKTDNVRCLVLDEADRLLDMGFKKDLIKIVEHLDLSLTNNEYNPMEILKSQNKKKEDSDEEIVQNEIKQETGYCLRNPLSNKRQTLLLSATLTKEIGELSKFIMEEHIYIDALDESDTINPNHMVIPKTVSQEYMITNVKHRLFTLASILVAKSKKNTKILVFMATSQMVDYHYDLFTKYLVRMPINRGKVKAGNVVLYDNEEINSDDELEEVAVDTTIYKLHGSMDQSKRKGEFSGFRAAKKGVLLCTDVAARGIDVPQADFVIQYNGPQSDEDYLHRVGRTGRAEQKGTALIFLTHEEQEYVTHLQDHKVFLKQRNPKEYVSQLCQLMEEPDEETAALALQKRFENAVARNKELYKMACFAYSSWSRFYSAYPQKLRHIFNFKGVNLGHYVTSFAIKDSPSTVAGVVRGHVAKIEPKRLNKKLAIHEEESRKGKSMKTTQKRKIKSISLVTSEFSSGLEPKKKRQKLN